ncbi:hypothetical protein CA2559_12983 [Croceibacter atlanticus HTCC2559]|uniref:Uncharacterized protein n=1 Tax=Croceibacter atlanticus (strain ATCC BAA-628 / JCM 21780 / CIP 108009 / IAM 15332 / KCTC 12090 / HTCC2559) TaxID=216432 RepID=A3UAW9_CROAH|nr:hypothetical protein CA2559_12983 [Croceibacter atlanticus HTCC2559]
MGSGKWGLGIRDLGLVGCWLLVGGWGFGIGDLGLVEI